ncbi:glycosyl hydrolase [Aspergillus floccosus]
MTSMTMWGSDPKYRTWPRVFWRSSPDLKAWSDVVWGEPYGIDPHLFRDPASGKDYLTMMGLQDGYNKLWGISQCQVNLKTGRCVGPFRNIWNGTLPLTAKERPEGPKLFLKDEYYYLLIAEGGTGATHRATIARSKSPEGPWESSPTNPLIFNGANLNLTIGSTGHATFADTPDGRWFATLLARRNIGSWSLGRETFFVSVIWKDGWPTMNGGEFLKPSQSFDYAPDQKRPSKPFEDHFTGPKLGNSWYQLRSPYTQNYRVGRTHTGGTGVVFMPNVFTLSDRDSPAAIMRKQTSLNMTFSATLLPTDGGLGQHQSIGAAVYSSGEAHVDFGLRGCANSTGMCLFIDQTVDSPGPGTPPVTTEQPLKLTSIPRNFTLHIRAEFDTYRLGYSTNARNDITWCLEFSSDLVPTNFDGIMLALFASGNMLPWPYDAPEVGFSHVKEVYYEEHWEDYRTI